MILLVAAFLLLHPGPADKNPPPVPAAGQPVDSVPAASSGTPLSEADWMQMIRQTPASGRAGLMRRILAIADEGLRNDVATALALEWMTHDPDEYLEFLDVLLVDGGLSTDSMKRFSMALMASFEKASGKAVLEGKMRYIAEVIVNYLIANDPGKAESWARWIGLGQRAGQDSSGDGCAIPRKGIEDFRQHQVRVAARDCSSRTWRGAAETRA